MNKTILIVDDSATLRASVNFVLTDAGYNVLQAKNGEEGLAKLLENKRTGEKVDMIISDINMPVMDGITFIKEVKKGDFRFIPILILTTESENSKKMEGKAAGASGWLVKPFKPEQLVWVVKKFVR
ncbi:MAG TPA: response regulator [bacterium]|jgi:two-component system chemotaxis response regulator CheY|nr:response regulator [bacterium]HPY14537.1 response regulator [bacterium]HQB08314.1 response regulator [bacterium]HQI03805.1 response regulator [bacterium]HQJ60770.1 response regulator [bacterium]